MMVQKGMQIFPLALCNDASHALIEKAVDHHAIKVGQASELNCCEIAQSAQRRAAFKSRGGCSELVEQKGVRKICIGGRFKFDNNMRITDMGAEIEYFAEIGL